VVLERPTLRQYVLDSDAALAAEVVAPLALWRAPDGSDRQEYYALRPVEILAGAGPEGPFEVFPHGEGPPRWQPGERALVFLERTAGRPELAGLAVRFPWFTLQEPGEEWRLAGAEGEAILAQARALAELARTPAGATLPRLRALLHGALLAPALPLRADARAELIRLRGAPGFLASAADAAPFAAATAEPRLPFAERVALARLLEYAPGFDAGRAFSALAREAREREAALALARGFATSTAPEVGVWLASLLAAPDPALRREAAAALGRGVHAAQVGPLARAAADPDERVARAALGALGAIGDPRARAALREVAGGAPPPRRDWAAAELRRLAQ
jgi:hypothetical protein